MISEVSGVRAVGPARNYTKNSDGSPKSTSKRYVAIHCTDNTASAANEASYALRRTDSVSFHFVIDDKEGIQCLPSAWRAWHAASQKGNNEAIGIEICGRATNSWGTWMANDTDITIAAKITATMCVKHGITPRWLSVAEMKQGNISGIVTHSNMTKAWGGTHTDPGPGFPYDWFIAKVKEFMGGTPANPPTPGTSSDWTERLIVALPDYSKGNTGQGVKNVQGLLNTHGYGLTEDGDFGSKTESAAKSYQRKCGLDDDGIVGKRTMSCLLLGKNIF